MLGLITVLICRPFFSATVFAKLLQTDPYGRISIMQFFNYVMRKVWLHQTRIGLSLYDVAGQGYLKESVSIIWKLLLGPYYERQIKPMQINKVY